MPPRPTALSLFDPQVPGTSSPSSVPSTSPPIGWLNAHCDGGARGNPGPAGYGAVLVDDRGMVVAELSEFLGVRTNNYAEYSGLLGCLQYALDHHHPRLRVVSDSELMVKQIQGRYKVNSPDLKPLWQEAKNRIARLEAFEIAHALRHKNKDADRLANGAMDRGMRPGQSKEVRPQDADGLLPPRATPYHTRAEVPADPYLKVEAHRKFEVHSRVEAYPRAETMLRGFTKDGVIHLLGSASLPDGIFVKIIRE